MGIAHVTRTIFRSLICGAVGSLLISGLALAWNIGSPTVTPDSLVVGVATTVTVTAFIADPSVVPASVILQSVDSSGRLIAILGNLHDDGVKGDGAAGDHRYTVQTTLSQATATNLSLRVAARFTGSRHRRFSPVITVPVLGSPASSPLYPGQRYPVGTYPRAHWHGPGAHIVILSGEGYSLLWEPGKPRTRIDWRPGTLFVPPAKWFYQHFNPGKEPARYLALKPWGFTYQVEDLVKTLEVEAAGGTQIDYKDQDPEIHQTFVQECAKRGVEARLKL